jgi:L-threonylcarbamoyladenylate synthase
MTPEDWSDLRASLISGELVCLPADTVYGLACLPQPEAVARIYAAKGRKERKPLSLVFSSLEQVTETIGGLGDEILAALAKLLPGAVTVVVPLKDPLAGMQIDSKESAGIRIIPPPLDALYRQLPLPLVMTSANLSGEPEPCAAYEVSRSLIEACAFVVDGGRCQHGRPSTVIDLRPLEAGQAPVVLRSGATGREELEDRLGSQVIC